MLELVEGSFSEGLIGETPVNYSQNFYPRYPGHDPVFCLSYADKNLCVLQFGVTYAVPVFRHWGEMERPLTQCNW